MTGCTFLREDSQRDSSREGARSWPDTRSFDETRHSAQQGLQGLQGLQVSMLYLGPMEKLLHLNAVLAQQARMLTYADVC